MFLSSNEIVLRLVFYNIITSSGGRSDYGINSTEILDKFTDPYNIRFYLDSTKCNEKTLKNIIESKEIIDTLYCRFINIY